MYSVTELELNANLAHFNNQAGLQDSPRPFGRGFFWLIEQIERSLSTRDFGKDLFVIGM
jgi:hypothetical protein